MTSIDLSGVRHIQARIAAIQEQFGIPGGVPGMDFDSMLKKNGGYPDYKVSKEYIRAHPEILIKDPDR